MLNAFAKKWVADLRSTTAVQGKGRLHTREVGIDRFCCLGRACVVAVEEGIIPPPKKGRESSFIYDEGWFALLPGAVQKALGLSTSSGTYGPKGKPSRSLVLNNDIYGRTFSEIADIIESEPEGLFVTS